MMFSHRIRFIRMLMVTLLIGAAWALLAMPVAAFAAPDEIGGCDHVFATQDSSGDGSVDILTVAGADGETIYLEVAKADGATVASHLCYVLHDDDGVTDEDGKVVGVASIASAAGVSLDGATVRVYGNRAQSQLLWSGTISAVYAKFGDGTEVPLAMRTLGEGEERTFFAPGTLTHDGAIYGLASDAPTIEDGHLCYAYEVSDDTPASVDGHISYYDTNNPAEPVKVDTIKGIGLGTTREVSIPDVITVGDVAYRTIQLTDKVTLSYPGATEYSVQCLPLASVTWANQGSFYKAKIHYVDADGRSLGVTDSVIVDRRYLYTPPTRLHVCGEEDDGFLTYVLSDSNDLSEGGAIVLEPGQATGTLDIDVTYEPIADDAERLWTVVLVNGSVSPGDPAREIRRVTYKGKPGKSVTHTTDASLDVNGATLVPTAFAESVYKHTFGTADEQITQTIYYVPDGWKEPDPYEVRVNYVNIATGGVISSEGYTATPTMRRDLEISTPVSFDKGGERYVRLNGQGRTIRHSFYSANREYNVYYREVNDDLHTKTVIRSIRVEYVDEETGETVHRPTTSSQQASSPSDGGATGAGNGAGAGATGQQNAQQNGTNAGNGTTNGGTNAGNVGNGTTNGNANATNGNATGTPVAAIPANPGTTVTGIGTDMDVASIIDEGAPMGIVTNNGSDLASVRIADNATPAAESIGKKDEGGANPIVLGIAIGIGAIVAAAAITALLIARRRRRDGDMVPNKRRRY